MSLLYFLLMIGVLVTVHELGHLIAAKLVGVKVLRFSLGFGPAIARVRPRETEYRIGVIPLGGYVRLLGEDPGDDVPEADRGRALHDKPVWQRLVVVFAGPAANLLCPVVIYFFLYANHTHLPAASIGDVFAGGPAAEAGILPGDRVLEINDERIRYWEDLEAKVDANVGKTLRFKIQRGQNVFFRHVTPRRRTMLSRTGAHEEQGLIGVTQAPFPPRIGVVDRASPAGRAGLRTGDLVMSVDGAPVASYTELEKALNRQPKRASLAYLRGESAGFGFADVKTFHAEIADLAPDVSVDERGVPVARHGVVSAEFFLSAVEPASPAAHAGLRAGDLIRTLDGQPVSHWVLFDQALQLEPDRARRIGWMRAEPDGTQSEHEADVLQIRRRVTDEYGQTHDQLVFGAANDFRPGRGEMIPIEGRFSYAASHAIDRTGTTVVEMVRGFFAILAGEHPQENVGGPITMYRWASVSGAKGWDSFLLMLALISVNLGLLNLLPIPFLDGGHLVIFAIEGVRRRRVSPRVRQAIALAGLLVIVSLTVLALKNDIVRYLVR